MTDRPGRPLASGFDYRPIEEFDALRLTDEDRADFDAWLAEVKRARLRAMETANDYVIG